MAVFRLRSRFFAKSIHCLIWLLIFTLLTPVSFMGPGPVQAAPDRVYASDNPANADIMQRLNSPERAHALEEAARIEAEARAQFERGEATAQRPATLPESSFAASAPDTATVAQDKGRSIESFRPQSVTEVLFNYAAGFVGVPGLAPQRGVDGYDEGLGFHQDGTVRRAGGTASASGPSDRGQRARSYMQSGFQNGYGMNGFGAGYGGLYGEMRYDPWGRGDPTRGGRIGAGNGYARELGDFDPLSLAIDRGLSYGAGLVNSLGEAALSGLVDGGRARLNFYLDKDGYFGGEGDVLLPWYDSRYTTIYTQFGARSMHDESDTRWIGNFGLGQRWFPAATEEDAGNWMLGYNAFFDYDFTRDHQRGGVGVEAQYDWLRLASNYYFPLSSWKGSEDFDSRFVRERPAKGWDIRVKGYLPFYRNLAVTGAYSQWYGEHVGMFGASDLEKDPKVWSYGLEYTPIPLVSGFITQKSTERGHSDTEFGLNFTYHFQMPWEDQISHSKVAELRTVGGSRHEFVDRENRIILEYKAKNSYQIEFVGLDGARGFLFRIKDGFGKYKAGQTVRVTAGGAYLAAAKPAEPQGFFAQAVNFLDKLISVKAAYAADLSKTYVTDGQGRFWVQLDASAPANTSVTVQAGENTQTFVLAGGGGSLNGTINVNVAGFSGGISTATLTLNAFDSQGNAVSGENVVWTVTQSTGHAAAVTTLFKSSLYGLELANLGRIAPSVYATVNPGDYTGKTFTTADIASSVTLTDIVGQRDVMVTAQVTIDGSSQTFTANVQFGNGPLYAFRLPSGHESSVPSAQWVNVTSTGNSTILPAAAMCVTPPDSSVFQGWTGGNDYSSQTGLPTQTELRTVATGTGNEAWKAAGWPFGSYWTGALYDVDVAWLVPVGNGSVGSSGALDSSRRFVCRR